MSFVKSIFKNYLKAHTVQFCDHKQLVECFNTRGQPPCIPECGYVPGVDDNPQILVANAFKARAALNDPQYILNVGDNFYWGGAYQSHPANCSSWSFSCQAYSKQFKTFLNQSQVLRN